jgi:ABC-type transport system involved in multi-copper enzyme maturation permease subunit
MTWLTWRQYRIQFAVGTAVLAALCLLLLLTGLQMFSQYHSIITECASRTSGPSGQNCSTGGGLFEGGPAAGFVTLIVLATPVLAGLFLGAPMVASEFEAGTARLGWVQSITRARWLWVKAGWLLLAAAAWGGVLAALTTWWAGPTNAEHGSHFYPGRFDIIDLMPVAYAVFGMALGICAGALIRRTVPAMAVTLGGFIGVRVAVLLWLRPHYMSAVTATRSLLDPIKLTGSYWLIHTGQTNPAGQPISSSVGSVGGPVAFAFGVPVSSLPKACAGLANPTGGLTSSSNPTGGLTSSCRAALTGYHSFVTYQPADRFWTFQGIETGIFVVLAAIALTVTAVVLLRRDA